MMRVRRRAWAVVAGLFIVFLAGSVLAADLPRVMIMGEDADPDTVPRDSRVFKRVLGAITNEMLNQGFDVKDETAMTHETHIQGRVRRTDAELIQIGKDAGVDVLAIFSIYPNAKSNENSVRVTSRIEGRLLDVFQASQMGNFEVDPDFYEMVPKPYSRDDILEAVGKLSKQIGSEVGQVLAQRLASYVDQKGGKLSEWTLIFDGFSPAEVSNAEEYLVIFSGYDTHRPKKNALQSSTHHEFLYMTSIDSAKLKSNVYKMLEKMNIEARVYMTGNEVKMVKTQGATQRRVKEQSDW